MKFKVRQIGMGLIFGLFAVFAGESQAQITKSIKNVTSTVTKPLKDVQSTTKSVTQPVKNVSTGVRDVTNAPRDVKNELKRTTSEFDRAGNDIKRVKTDVQKSTSGIKGKGDKDKDSTKTASRTSGETVVIDQRTDRDAVGAEEIATNPDLPKSTGTTTSRAPDPFEVRAPTKKAEPVADAGERGVHLPPPVTEVSRSERPKPDHSKSPARYALERADFDVETLYDLFASADWDGPGREHTQRSIEFTLQHLKADIAETKKLDPMADTSYYSARYKEWYAEYTRRSREEDVVNEVIIE